MSDHHDSGRPRRAEADDERRASVEAANQSFYDAHEARDLDAMRRIWAHDDDVVCVHPGWPILRGWEAVEASWRGIFDGPGRNQFILTNRTVTVAGDTAWVTLEENLVDRGAMAPIAATNVFRRRIADVADARDEAADSGVGGSSGEWVLIVHHASPVVAQVR